MDILIVYKNEQKANVVSRSEIKIGEKFSTGITKEGKEIIKEITEVHEQRKERGTYADESKRRNWANVSYSNI